VKLLFKKKRKNSINLRYHQMHRFYKEKLIEQGRVIILNEGLKSMRESFVFRSKQRKKQYLKQKILHAHFNSDAIHMQVSSRLTGIISTHVTGKREIEREREREKKKT